MGHDVGDDELEVPPPKRGSNTGLLLGLFACGCLLLAVGMGVFFLFVGGAAVGGALAATQGGFEAAHAHVKLVQQGKVDEAYAATGQGFRDSIDLEGFKAFVAQWGVLYAPGADLTITNRRINNGQGVMEGMTRGPDGAEADVTIIVGSEGGTWKVLGVNLKAR